MDLALGKSPYMLYMPTELLGNLAFTLNHSASMMPVISTSSVSVLASHTITPLGIRPSLQRSQGEHIHPLQAGRDGISRSNEYHVPPLRVEYIENLLPIRLGLRPLQHDLLTITLWNESPHPNCAPDVGRSLRRLFTASRYCVNLDSPL